MKVKDIFSLQKRLYYALVVRPINGDGFKIEHRKSYFFKKVTSMCEDCPARSKAIGSEPILVGVRAFESHSLH